MSSLTHEVIVVGGGLAGLCASIHLAKEGRKVVLFEPKPYPRHKVCGEYISKEVLPYLSSLGFDPFEHGAVKIDRFEWSHPKGRSIKTQLPLGGFGLSRYTIEEKLVQLAIGSGVQLLEESAAQLDSVQGGVEVQTTQGNIYKAQFGIAAYGKRSQLDKKLGREFISQKANFMAAKWHAKGEFPEDLVALHNFEGGYCGVSKVENDRINFCFITTYESFKAHKDLPTFIQQVLGANGRLKKLLDTTEMIFEKPLSIAQISFKDKPPVEGNWLMCGDTAGLIHPLSGNGMSMAIRSAELAALQILTAKANAQENYKRLWRAEFKKRLRMGRIAAAVFGSSQLSMAAVNLFKLSPAVLRMLISQTHGKLDKSQTLKA